MIYKHTQTGHLIIFVFLALALYFGFILTKTGLYFAVLAIMVFVMLVLISFATLNVVIDEKELKIKFGYGIFKTRFVLKDIVSAKTVKNRWYYGWGIRLVLWPRMWVYNVSGFDAVEIKLKNGKIYRIGTDEPKKLEQMLLQAIKN